MAHLNWKRWLLTALFMAISSASQAITIDLAEAAEGSSAGNTATLTSGETNLCVTPACAGTKNPERITGWSAIFAGTFSDGSGLELIGLTEGTPANGGIISDIIRVQWAADSGQGLIQITIDFFSDADNGTIFGSPVGTCSPTGAAPAG